MANLSSFLVLGGLVDATRESNEPSLPRFHSLSNEQMIGLPVVRRLMPRVGKRGGRGTSRRASALRVDWPLMAGVAVFAVIALCVGFLLRSRRSAAAQMPIAGQAGTGLAGSRLQRGGVLWLVFRFPVMLYRLNLGWLLGHRMLLVTHQGRRTGQIHQTVLEVVRYDVESREAIVVSAWGERGDWYRNLRASPAVEVAIGSERYQPTQRFLTTDEIEAELKDYQRRHPRLIRAFGAWLGFPVDGTDEALRRFAESVRMVAFRQPAES